MRVVDEKIGLEREREMLMLSLILSLASLLRSAAYLFVGCHELTLFSSQTSPPPQFNSPLLLLSPLIIPSSVLARYKVQSAQRRVVFAPLKVERDVAPPPPEAETIIIEMIEVISHFARTVSLSVCLSMNQSLAILCVSN